MILPRLHPPAAFPVRFPSLHSQGPLDITDSRGRTLLDFVCQHSLSLDAHCLEALWDAVRVLGRWPLRPSLPFVKLIDSRSKRQDSMKSGQPESTSNQGGKWDGRGKGLDEILDNQTLLGLACENGDVSLVKFLLDLGASPNVGIEEARAREKKHPYIRDRNVPLVQACRLGDETLAKALIERGHAILDVFTTSGPLHLARRSLEVCKCVWSVLDARMHCPCASTYLSCPLSMHFGAHALDCTGRCLSSFEVVSESLVGRRAGNSPRYLCSPSTL